MQTSIRRIESSEDEVFKKKQENMVAEAKEAREPSAVEGPAPDDADGHSSADST